MDSGHERHTRTTATAVAAPDLPVPTPRTAPPVESAAPDTAPIPVVAPVVTDEPGTGPIATVPAVPPTVPPTAAVTVTSPCRCGHGRDAHEHFRRGTDCAGCDCARYRRPGLLTRLRG